jgi:murein DD-endopeptidase / murein LD-carboxypeptidase
MFFITSCHHTKEVSKTKTNTTTATVSSSKTKIVAEKLGISEKDVKGKKLYSFISEWYETPYKYGGCGKDGVDCSCFTGTLYYRVYGKIISRTSSQLYKESDHIKTKNLEEGDLVFFKIASKDISHVGVYLKDDKFVHASTKKGVMISSLQEQFFKDTYYGAGRVK